MKKEKSQKKNIKAILNKVKMTKKEYLQFEKALSQSLEKWDKETK